MGEVAWPVPGALPSVPGHIFFIIGGSMNDLKKMAFNLTKKQGENLARYVGKIY